jgi:hypothetical protein
MTLQTILTEVSKYVKLFIQMIIPLIKTILRALVPIIVTIVMFFVNLDYYKIFTNRAFITFMSLLIIFFFTYAYLYMFHPVLLQKIIDFLTLKGPKKDRFKFVSSVDLSVESK